MSPSMLMQGEALRPMAHAAVATLDIYYRECIEEKEMPGVHLALSNAVFKVSGDTLQDPTPHLTLCNWGTSLRRQFDSDNEHMTARKRAAQLLTNVAALQNQVYSNWQH